MYHPDHMWYVNTLHVNALKHFKGFGWGKNDLCWGQN